VTPDCYCCASHFADIKYKNGHEKLGILVFVKKCSAVAYRHNTHILCVINFTNVQVCEYPVVLKSGFTESVEHVTILCWLIVLNVSRLALCCHA
jgi:hypothetical protein